MLRSLICLIFLASSAAAQDTEIADRLETNFRDWADAVGVRKGTIAIRRKGAPVRVVSIGRPADAPIDLASTGKAITALCVLTLVREGKLNWSDDLRDLLGQGPPDTTVAALVNHTSGIGPDSTQDSMNKWLSRPRHHGADVLDAVDGRDLAKEPGQYAYNNENYAILAQVIEQVTDRPYREACYSRVLEPAGIEMPPVGRAEGFLPWGGWTMRADDFAAVHWHWFGTGLDPFNLPHTAIGGGAYYGMGTVFREFRGAHNFWHFGALCFPLRFNRGSYAVIWQGEWSAVVGYESCVDWDDMFALDSRLVQAVFGGKQ